MKKGFALALAAILLAAALAGCGGNQKVEDGGLVGTWRGEVSLDALFNSRLTQSGMSEVADVEGAAAAVELAVKDDGTYAISLDEAALSAAVDAAKEQARQGLADHLEKTFQPQDISLDAALAEAGTSLEQLVDRAFNAAVLDQLAQQVKAEGRYALQEGQLLLSQGPDREPDVQQSYTLSGDALRLDIAAGSPLASLEGLQTVALQRVSP